MRFEPIWPLEEGLLGHRAGPNRRLDYTSQNPSRHGRVLCWGKGDSFSEVALESGTGEQVRGTLANCSTRSEPIRGLYLGPCRNGGWGLWLCLPSSDTASPAGFEVCFQLGRSTFCNILEGVTR